jgi:16S rRNA C967 or C1407 C5-methylase (RsmB/RsmF family)
VCESVADYDAMMLALSRPLPLTFRLHAQGRFVDALRARVVGELSAGYPFHTSEEDQRGSQVEAVVAQPPQEIAWYPDRNGWKLCVSRPALSKIKGLEATKRFLVLETDAGNITRQEEASMIPPFFLDVHPHHRVLDMAAAPGSKTTQLLEALHCEDAARGFAPPPGFVVANDAVANRAYMLVNRCKRLASPNLLVTAHEAQRFPNPARLGQGLGRSAEQEGVGFFDRILADVPCSGDGTVRKAPDIWKSFTPRSGLALHALQLSIAQRGLELLKLGGLLVYSTCSLNPVEDEAVVAELLRQAKGALELVDTAGTLPLLKRRAGKSTWRPACLEKVPVPGPGPAPGPKEHELPPAGSDLAAAREAHIAAMPRDRIGLLEGANPAMRLRTWDSPEDAAAHPGHQPMLRIPPSVWPPTPDEAARFHLDRCMRILPHDNDTSGFFVAVLRMTAPLPVHAKRFEAFTKASEARATETAAAAAAAEAHVALDQDADADAAPTPTPAPAPAPAPVPAPAPAPDATGEPDLVGRDDEVRPLPPSLWLPICTDYGFPAEGGPGLPGPGNMFYRAGGGDLVSKKDAKRRKMEREQMIVNKEASPPNVLYCCSDMAESILNRNGEGRMRVVSAGLVLFKRNHKVQQATDLYRISQGAVKVVLSSLTKRKVKIALDDLLLVWRFHNHTSAFKELHAVATRFPGVPFAALSRVFRDSSRDERGAVVAELDHEDQLRYVAHFGEPLAITAWVGKDALAPLIGRLEINSLVDQLKRGEFLTQAALDAVLNPDDVRRELMQDKIIQLINEAQGTKAPPSEQPQPPQQEDEQAGQDVE